MDAQLPAPKAPQAESQSSPLTLGQSVSGTLPSAGDAVL